MDPFAPMDRPVAEAVHAALVEHAGASASDVDQFVHHQTDRLCEEYRFGGLLGWGGKFRRNIGRRPDGTYGVIWYVDGYPEDMTDERRAVVERTNEALHEIRVQALGS